MLNRDDVSYAFSVLCVIRFTQLTFWCLPLLVTTLCPEKK